MGRKKLVDIQVEELTFDSVVDFRVGVVVFFRSAVGTICYF